MFITTYRYLVGEAIIIFLKAQIERRSMQLVTILSRLLMQAWYKDHIICLYMCMYARLGIQT